MFHIASTHLLKRHNEQEVDDFISNYVKYHTERKAEKEKAKAEVSGENTNWKRALIGAKQRFKNSEDAEFVISKYAIAVKYGTDRPKAMLWKTNREKPSENYVFRTTQERDAWVQEEIEDILKRNERYEKEASQNTVELKSLRPGDIVYGIWGSEQTNASFYEVLSINNTEVRLVEL